MFDKERIPDRSHLIVMDGRILVAGAKILRGGRMSVHYFHCTDGADLVIDRRGRRIGDRQNVDQIARRVARDLKAAVPHFQEWEGWAVHVYDERGQVSIVPFQDRADAACRC